MIQQGATKSFKTELLLGVHDFRATGGDVFKLALYTAEAELGPDTTAYTTDGEVVGAGYPAGGYTLINLGVLLSGSSGVSSFARVAVPGVTLTARGGLIYNTTPSASGLSGPLANPAVAVLNFGSDQVRTNTTLIIEFPAMDSTNAVIRVA